MSVQRVRTALESAFQAGLNKQNLRELSDSALRSYRITAPSEDAPLGSAVGDDCWIWPHTQVPRTKSGRSVPFSGLSAFPILGMSIRRYILAQLLFPRVKYLDIAGLKKRADYLSRIARIIGTKLGDMTLAEVSPEEFVEAFNIAMAGAPSLRVSVATYVSEMHFHDLQGTIQDSFRQITARSVNFLTEIDGALPDRPTTSQEDAYGKYLPLPDKYVAEAGRIWSFYIDEILPNLEAIFQHIPTIEQAANKPRAKVWGGRGGHLDPSTAKRRRSKAWQAVLKKHKWRSASGQLIESLPFNSDQEFLPRSQNAVFSFWSVVQGSLAQLLLLLTGARLSEIYNLSHDCLVASLNIITNDHVAKQSRHANLKGRTFKLSGSKQGDERNWPLPERISKAIEIQQRLVGLIGTNEDSLWVSTNRAYWLRGKINLYHYTTEFPATHGIGKLLDGAPAHPHRFRKTIARLAVLSLSGAPLILQEILGHSDLETTMKYILSEPDIRSDIADLAVEIQIEQATGVAEGLDDAGGKGAVHLRSVRDTFFDNLKVPRNERQQRRRMDEFIEAKLTDDSADLKLLFPGIICTKPKAAVGACGLKDEINVSSCQATCTFFLALPSIRPETERTIEWLISELGSDKVDGNILLRPWYTAQLAEQISIFPELREKYRQDPRCIQLVKQGLLT